MARQRFKSWWTQVVPEPIERSTYVLFASLALLVLCWAWQPISGVVWSVEQPIGRLLLWGLYGTGWLIAILSTFMISHTELFGLKQVVTNLREREPTASEFQTPWLYRFVRHPLMTGLLLAFWATPRMTVGHLVFAIGMTLYILVGITLEERDLVTAFGDRYRQYQTEVPMFVPLPGRTVSPSPDETDGD